MSELRRLLDDGGANPDEARMLRAALDDGLAPKSKERVASALAAAGVMSAATASAATGAAVAHTAGRAGLGWLWRFLVGVATVAGGASLLRGPTQDVLSAPSSIPSSVATVGSRAPSSEQPALPSIAPPEAPQPPAPSASTAGPALAKNDARPASSASLSDQLAMIDAAREQLRSHRPAEALATLDGYSRSYPRGAFGQEATLVRIEALLASGQRPEAVRLAHQFLDRAPKSAYARRVRSLIGEQ